MNSGNARRALVQRTEYLADPLLLYRRWREAGGQSVFLESARFSPKTGRYSLLAKDPFLIFQSKGSHICVRRAGRKLLRFEGEAFSWLRRFLREVSWKAPEPCPPFAGGAIGYFGYEVKNLIEPHLPQKAQDDLGLPDIYLLFFDRGVLVDHQNQETCLFAARGAALRALQKELISCLRPRSFSKKRPSTAPSGKMALWSSVTRPQFLAGVQKAKDYIRKGDIFQANLSQRFGFRVEEESLSIYERLRGINPSSFFGFLDAGDFQILSGSPERLVKLENGILETRPIAGTRSRGRNKAQDRERSLELLLNEKERAEHIMLVDLERNDLGRVAEYGSVGVDELMVLEDYSHVKHIVSNVRGVLKTGCDALDVLKAFFPGGTITGAPKVRCMEIIDEIEPVARGPYTGSLGYLSFNGNMDLNILIRSLVRIGDRAFLHVGAGIVADSIPEKEYDETLYKAQALFSALFGEKKARRVLQKLGAGSLGARQRFRF